MDPIRLPDIFFPSEFGTSYLVFLAASGGMRLNFFGDVGGGQIGHLPNLPNLCYNIFKFEIFFRQRVIIDVEC